MDVSRSEHTQRPPEIYITRTPKEIRNQEAQKNTLKESTMRQLEKYVAELLAKNA